VKIKRGVDLSMLYGSQGCSEIAGKRPGQQVAESPAGEKEGDMICMAGQHACTRYQRSFAAAMAI
jgi:hypothetical protein